MTAEPVNLSMVEDRLTSDTDGSYKKDLIKKLESEMTHLKNKKNSGLAPDEFEQADNLILALEESIKVIELTWFRYHKTKNS